ncbi:MAG TPA: SAM-dependent methyltransferase, partial [Pseudomonadales bacterium]|nr:SAM-dependent methyltransferase [Pseudomonadales bacterium]
VEKWQNRINPIWQKVGGGCNLNRRPDQNLIEAGFGMDAIEEGYLNGPRWATYNYRGVAKRR